MAKLLIILGVTLALVGVLWLAASKWLGGAPLPGTFVFQSGNLTCFVSILGSIVLSILLTLVANIVLRLLDK